MIDSQTVNRFMNAGLAFIPVGAGPDGKRPIIDEWGQYKARRPDPEEIAEMPFRDATGIAVIGGLVSGGVVCLDFDLKNDTSGKDLWSEFRAAVQDAGLTDAVKDKTYIQKTINSGYHIIYKSSCRHIDRFIATTGLAFHDGKKIIETRSINNYFLVYPSPGYEVVLGDVCDLTALTPEEEAGIIDICRTIRPQKTTAPNGSKEIQVYTSKEAEGDVKKLVDIVCAQTINLTKNYDDWIAIAFGLAKEFGEKGRVHFHAISAQDERYDFDESNKKYDSCLRQNPHSKHYTIRTLFYLAKKEGIIIAGDPNLDELQEEIQRQGVYWNVISSRYIYADGTSLKSHEFERLAIDVKKALPSAGYAKIDRYLRANIGIPPLNPIQQYFEEIQLKPVSGSPIDEYINAFKFHPDSEPLIPILKKWIISVVASAFGTPCQIMVILIGDQYCGKSYWIETILPPKLREYCCIDDLDNKDTPMKSYSKLIMYDDEFGNKNKRDAKKLKMTIAMPSVSIRRPYARTVEDFPRLAVYAGTSNLADVVNDLTGNRRLIPIECISRDRDTTDSIDRDDIWAEAAQIYFRGVTEGKDDAWVTSFDDINQIKVASERYQAVNPERDLLLEFFAPSNSEEGDFLTTTMIGNHIQMHSAYNNINVKKLGQELRFLKFNRGTKRLDGTPLKGWWVRKRGEMVDDAEIEEIEKHISEPPF